MAKESENNIGNICLLLFLLAIIIIIIYFYSTRRCVKNTGTLNMDINQNNVDKNNVDKNNVVRNIQHNNNTINHPMINEVKETMQPGPDNQELNVHHEQVNHSSNKPIGCFPKEQLNPEELLPQDNANVWAQANPSGEGSLKDRNFLQAGHHVGVNTVGQTLRNANMQLRSEPPNPQVKVSPWQQTTIDPDVNRKPLEIGGCA